MRRHRCADAALAFYLSKADPLLVLRDLLGHSSVLTTEKYLRRLDTTRIYRRGIRTAPGRQPGLTGDTGAEGAKLAEEFAGEPSGRGADAGEVIEAPLGIACVFSDGRRAEYHLGRPAQPRSWPVTC